MITIIIMFSIVICLQTWMLYLVLYDKPLPKSPDTITGPIAIRSKTLRAFAKGEKLKPLARSEQEEWEMEQTKG